MNTNECKNSILISENFREFSNNSTIHGFHDLYYAKSIVWKIIWVILLVSATSISTFQLYKLTVDAINEPTKTLIKPLSYEIEYPPLSICYVHWIYWVNWSHVEKLGLDKPSALYGLGFIIEIKSSVTINLSEAKYSFLRIMKANGFTKLTDFYGAIAMSQPPGFERTDMKFSLNMNMQRGLFCYVAYNQDVKNALPKADTGKRAVKLVFNPNFYKPDERYVKTKEYEQYLFYRLQDMATVNLSSTVINYTDVRVYPMINVDGVETSWIMLEENMYDAHITVNSALDVWLNNGSPKCKSNGTTENYNYCTLYCDLNEYTVQHPNDCIDLTGASALGIDTFANVCEYDVHFLDTNTIVSRNRKNRQGLVPQTYSYNSCIAERCIVPCKNWKHTSMCNTVSIPRQFSVIPIINKFTITYPSVSSILQMTQVESQTWESLVADIGGIVGLWLGAGALSIVQMVYLLCCSLCDQKLSDLETTQWWYKERKKTDEVV